MLESWGNGGHYTAITWLTLELLPDISPAPSSSPPSTLSIPHRKKQQFVNCLEGGNHTQNHPTLLPRGGCGAMTADPDILCIAAKIKPRPLTPLTYGTTRRGDVNHPLLFTESPLCKCGSVLLCAEFQVPDWQGLWHNLQEQLGWGCTVGY